MGQQLNLRPRLSRRLRSVRDRFRVATIESGPAQGLRIGMRHASNDYPSGTVEEPVQRALGELLEPGDVFFDVGANIGFFTLVASRFVGDRGGLYAFEARASIAKSAEKNFRRNGLDAIVIPVAVGDSNGTTTLLVAEHPGGSTIEQSKAVTTLRVQSVDLVTLDHLVESGRVRVPDVVKIDVEGAEPAVVRGMHSTLERHRPIVLFELDDAELSKVERQYVDMQTMFSEVGYLCERLDPSYVDVGWHVIHAVARPEMPRC